MLLNLLGCSAQPLPQSLREPQMSAVLCVRPLPWRCSGPVPSRGTGGTATQWGHSPDTAQGVSPREAPGPLGL